MSNPTKETNAVDTLQAALEGAEWTPLGKNIEYTRMGSSTLFRMDHTKAFGRTGTAEKPGKNTSVASTGGNKPIIGGITVGFNAYKPLQ